MKLMISIISHQTARRGLISYHARKSPHQTHQRLYSTRPGAEDRYKTPLDLVLESRSRLFKSQPLEQLRVAGVSFDGRQDTVSKLKQSQALAFVKEPSNQYDPNAVAITTLDSRPIGYVPKERTLKFLHSLCFGKVLSVGQTAEERGPLWGCFVEVQTRIPPLTVLPLPQSLSESELDVLGNLSGAKWDAYKRDLLAKNSSKCSISGSFCTSLTERWDFQVDNNNGGSLKLVGFAVQSPEITRIQKMLFAVDRNDDGKNFEYKKSLLQRMNGWSIDDVDLYLEHILDVQNEYNTIEKWQLDLSLLQKLDVV